MEFVGFILIVAFWVFFWIIIPLFFGMPGLGFGGGGGFRASAPMIQLERKTKYKYAVYPGGSADIPSACIRSSDDSVMLFNTDDEARVLAQRLSKPGKKFYVQPVAVGRRWGIK